MTLLTLLGNSTAGLGDGLYCEYTAADGATSGTLKLFRKDGTQLGTTLDLLCAEPDIWHRITICYDPDTDEFTACFDARDSRGYVVQGQCVSATVPTGFVAGTQAGYGGAGSIKNYKYDRLWYCGDPPYTEECILLNDPYETPQTRTVCHKCGSPSCTIVSETFAGIVGDINTPGDMPCGWDASATNWGIVDGAATGDGAVCHLFDTTAGTYTISAGFTLGHLETLGDSVTVSLRHGSTTHSLTVTRVISDPPGGVDRLRYDWVPTEFATTYAALNDGTAGFEICPYKICNNLVQIIVEEVVTPGPVCVSITQPTMSGHEDAALIRLTITKSKEMDDDCPECGCTTVCADYCKNSIWPSGFLAELSGLESLCCDVSTMNKGYYVTNYSANCSSYGYGDDGLGVPLYLRYHFNPLTNSLLTNGTCHEFQGGAGWFEKGGVALKWEQVDPTVCVDCGGVWCPEYEPTTLGEIGLGGCFLNMPDCATRTVEWVAVANDDLIEYPITVTVALIPATDFGYYPWASYWQSVQACPGATHAIIASFSRRVYSTYNGWGSQIITYGKMYSEVTDCANLVDEELHMLYYENIYNGVTYWYFVVYEERGKCDFYNGVEPDPPGGFAYYWGLPTGNPYLGGGSHGWSNSVMKLTAL